MCHFFDKHVTNSTQHNCTSKWLLVSTCHDKFSSGATLGVIWICENHQCGKLKKCLFLKLFSNVCSSIAKYSIVSPLQPTHRHSTLFWWVAGGDCGVFSGHKKKVNLPGRQERQWRHPVPRPLPLTADSPRGTRWYPELHSRSRTPASLHSSHLGRSARLRAPSAGPGARPCGPPHREPARLLGSVSGRIPSRAALPGAAGGSLQPPGDWWTHRRHSRREHPGRSPEVARQLEEAARGRTHHGVRRTRWMPFCGEAGQQTQTVLGRLAAAEHWSSLRGGFEFVLWWLVPLCFQFVREQGNVLFSVQNRETKAISWCDNSFSIFLACLPLVSFH